MNSNNNADTSKNGKNNEGNIWNILNKYHGIRKVAMAPLVGVLYVSSETVKIAEEIKIGDKSVFDRWVDLNKKSEKEKEEHPYKWAAKKIVKGALWRTIFPK